MPESGGQAGYDGAKRRKGSRVHIAGLLRRRYAWTFTGVEGHGGQRVGREQVASVVEQVQHVAGNTVELVYVDQGHEGENAAMVAEQHSIQLCVIKHPVAKRGFFLLPKPWVAERSFAWAARFRRLARDQETTTD